MNSLHFKFYNTSLSYIMDSGRVCSAGFEDFDTMNTVIICRYHLLMYLWVIYPNLPNLLEG